MRRVWLVNVAIVLFLTACQTIPAVTASEPEGTSASTIPDCTFDVGIDLVDVTPTNEVLLGGSPFPKKTSEVDTPLFVKAMVISSGTQKVAIVTLDHLKYPSNLADIAREQIEESTGIPFDNIIICSSHTHSSPMWWNPCYKEDNRLLTPIHKAVELAAADLEPCKLGTATETVEGITRNRRLMVDGEVWNRWLVDRGAPDTTKDTYPAEGPIDPELIVLAAVNQNGKYKAILYNYACHADVTRPTMISADYPGHVQKVVSENLGYAVPALFLAGACGDINPYPYGNSPDNSQAPVFGRKLGNGVLESLEHLEFITSSTLCAESRNANMPGREDPCFAEEEITRKWPETLEVHRKAFQATMSQRKPTYEFWLSGIRIGDNFAIVTNPDELFCQTGLDIKKGSPFKRTMVVEQTNGSHGYIPTPNACEAGGYEAWYGEHSYLSTNAATIIETNSLDILAHLKNK
ncbi:MAG: hypothetical protein IT422_02860 [Pirellulaceae bacterium]|jgi:neutral ceramidase|nr:hypothetical protein [Pirellulaceae bacterium]